MNDFVAPPVAPSIFGAAEQHYVATVPRGLGELLAAELGALGASNVVTRPAGVTFSGSFAIGYSACLWSRVASRILLRLTEFDTPDLETFHAGVYAVDWREHINPASSIACEFTGKHNFVLNSRYGALRVKDAVCDQLRDTTGTRPDVSLQRPAVRLHAHGNGAHVTLYLDLAGEGLHRRGYRTEAGEAPLRENLAAGILLRAGWPALAANGAGFIDPMCGAGTLVIEAAMMAANLPPGLKRDYWGFNGWLGHNAALWQSLCQQAEAGAARQLPQQIAGLDVSARAVRMAEANAARAGVGALVRFMNLPATSARPTDLPSAQLSGSVQGLVASNPPYGVRLGDAEASKRAHRELGTTLRTHFAGWEAAIITAAPDGAHELGLRTYRTHDLWNGALECRLLRVDLADAGAPAPRDGALRAADVALAESPGARMFANRLLKNQQRLLKQAGREQVSCLRLYDADMPEYAFAIDRYTEAATGLVHLLVQEYAAPASVDEAGATRRRNEALAALPLATEVPNQRIHLRVRQRQRGLQQYQRFDDREQFMVVEEQGLKFLVNLYDFLDTGLFLDHRATRAHLRSLAAGKRVLNLFCYTATASVCAAAGGAASTLSIDLSNTYLNWAAANYRLNELQKDPHELLRADCLQWLKGAVHEPRRFDLIFLDPPTFSNSKRMEGVLDTQRDHAALIDGVMQLLDPGGLLVFSTNAQRFKLDQEVTERWQVKDISAATLPFDFERNERIHRCYEVRARE